MIGKTVFQNILFCLYPFCPKDARVWGLNLQLFHRNITPVSYTHLVYYVHSYYGKNCTESTLAVSDYSITVTGAVRAGRVYGTQFHPEKSGDTGLRILKAFAEL